MRLHMYMSPKLSKIMYIVIYDVKDAGRVQRIEFLLASSPPAPSL